MGDFRDDSSAPLFWRQWCAARSSARSLSPTRSSSFHGGRSGRSLNARLGRIITKVPMVYDTGSDEGCTRDSKRQRFLFEYATWMAEPAAHYYSPRFDARIRRNECEKVYEALAFLLIRKLISMPCTAALGHIDSRMSRTSQSHQEMVNFESTVEAMHQVIARNSPVISPARLIHFSSFCQHLTLRHNQGFSFIAAVVGRTGMA